MSNLFPLFADNLLPILLAAGAGYLLATIFDIDAKAVSRVAFYILSPCLVFTLLTENELSNGDILRMAGFVVVHMLILASIVFLIGKLLKLERSIFAAVMLTVLFGNAGNFGLSLNLFAFGEEALAQASLFFVTTSILSYTFGVLIASLGKSSIKKALLGVTKVPAVYAVILALLFIGFKWELPTPLERTTSTLANGAIPVMIVLLGIQLRRVTWDGLSKGITASTAMRLVVSPLLAILIVPLFGFAGAARQAAIIESGPPSAVTTTVLATEYDAEPGFVTMVVFITTIISPLTVTPILAYLGG